MTCHSEDLGIHLHPRNLDLRHPHTYHYSAVQHPEKRPEPSSGPPQAVPVSASRASHVACFLPLCVVSGQHELDSTVFLPAPADLGESAAEAGQEEEALGQDDHAGQEQCECECGRQVELVVVFLKGTGPAVGECVHRAQRQGHEAQRGLRKKEGRNERTATEARAPPVRIPAPCQLGGVGFRLPLCKSQG